MLVAFHEAGEKCLSIVRFAVSVTIFGIEYFRRGRYQPRRNFDEDKLRELADSISAQGMIQPIVVRPVGKKKYEIIAGERRWRAAQRAGLVVIPAIIREIEDVSSLEQAVVDLDADRLAAAKGEGPHGDLAGPLPPGRRRRDRDGRFGLHGRFRDGEYPGRQHERHRHRSDGGEICQALWCHRCPDGVPNLALDRPLAEPEPDSIQVRLEASTEDGPLAEPMVVDLKQRAPKRYSSAAVALARDWLPPVSRASVSATRRARRRRWSWYGAR